MNEMNRREFVAAACAACMCAGGVAMAAEPGGPVDAGELGTYAKDGIYDQFAKTNKIFLIRNKGKLYATSAVCTHKSSLLEKHATDPRQIECSKHGSVFNMEGAVTKAPAKKALPRYAIAVNDQKHVIVDTSKAIEEGKWNEAGAFVTVA